METTPDVFVPASFVRAAIAHLERTGAPLLPDTDTQYSSDFLAWDLGDGTYQLSDADWKAPTWREYAELLGVELGELRDRFPFPKRIRRPDSPIPNSVWYQLDEMDSALSAAFDALQPLGVESFVCAELSDREGGGVLGGVEWSTGSYPGDNLRTVHVTSPVALSCLQRELNARSAGIRIRIRAS